TMRDSVGKQAAVSGKGRLPIAGTLARAAADIAPLPPGRDSTGRFRVAVSLGYGLGPIASGGQHEALFRLRLFREASAFKTIARLRAQRIGHDRYISISRRN